jgi:hypothetical protein
MYKQHRQPSTEAQKFGRLADHLTDSACIAISDLRWLGDVKASRLEAPRGCACDCWHYRRGAPHSSGTRRSFEPEAPAAASSRTHARVRRPAAARALRVYARALVVHIAGAADLGTVQVTKCALCVYTHRELQSVKL